MFTSSASRGVNMVSKSQGDNMCLQVYFIDWLYGCSLLAPVEGLIGYPSLKETICASRFIYLTVNMGVHF